MPATEHESCVHDLQLRSQARELLEMLISHNMLGRNEPFAALIEAYAAHEQWREAMDIFQRMKQCGVGMNGRLFNSISKMLVEKKQWALLSQLAQSFQVNTQS
jgi:pentatricopeptide repeat protein